MDQICLVLPIVPGKTEDARAFQRKLDTDRKADYYRSERRIGITKEVWYIASVPGGDQLIAYMESADFNQALQRFVASQDEFDQWFKRRLAEVTGVDLNNLPPDMQLPELVSRYEAELPLAVNVAVTSRCNSLSVRSHQPSLKEAHYDRERTGHPE